jgi:hypothetical protein
VWTAFWVGYHVGALFLSSVSIFYRKTLIPKLLKGRIRSIKCFKRNEDTNITDKHGERFHQAIATIEQRYQDRADGPVMTDYCWLISRRIVNLNKKLICWLCKNRS